MAITTEEWEAALEAAQRRLLEFGSTGIVKRVSHSGDTTSRDAEFDNMTLPQLKQHIAWLERKLGRGCARTPLNP